VAAGTRILGAKKTHKLGLPAYPTSVDPGDDRGPDQLWFRGDITA
jgi:hypothetical protein